MMKHSLWFTIFSFFISSAIADDWAKWLGPTGDSVYHEQGVITSIPDEGLKVLWEAPVAMGYSGPSVANGRVYLMDYVRDTGELTNNAGTRDQLTGVERVICIDAETGEQIWKVEYPRSYRISYPGGPRCIPVVADGKVYALGAEGNLNVLEADSGKQVWSKNFNVDFNSETPVWGYAAHPLVYRDTIYCIVGGEGSVVVAFDKNTGKERWRALSASSQGYCPPSIVKHGGVEQLLIWHAEALSGLNPETGEVYWSEDLKPSWGGAIQVPRKLGSQLYVAGPGAAALYQLENDNGKPGIEMIWRGNPRNAVYAVNGSLIFDKSAIYGVDQVASALIAVNREDGSRLWETQEPILAEVGTRAKHGTAFLVRYKDSNLYYILSETGDLIFADITPDGYKELNRQHVLEPTNATYGRPVVWSHPAFAERTMYARNDKKLIAVDLNESHYSR
jgi:outer membrane protein assembly factor BamB